MEKPWNIEGHLLDFNNICDVQAVIVFKIILPPTGVYILICVKWTHTKIKKNFDHFYVVADGS